MLELKNIFGEVLPTFTFVDIGAMSFDSEPYAPMVKQGIGSVIGFEPVSEECEKLNQIHRDSSHLFLPYAIGDGSAGIFNICNFPMTSSLFVPNTPLLEKFQNLGELMQVVRKEQVTTRRLDDLTEVSEADYLKIDAQGAELSILQGARRLLEQVMVVHTEVEFVPLYEGQPLFADVDAELRRQGFLLHKFQRMSGRSFKPFARGNSLNRPVSQVLWADVIYVKDFTRLNEIAPRKLLKLAILLHELYQSYDLCALAIKSFDEQTGLHLYDHYCRCITSASLSEDISIISETPAVAPSGGRFVAISIEKAIHLFEAGHTDQAIELCQEILSAFPGNDEVLLLMAKMYKNSGRIDEAMPRLRAISQQSSWYADALFTLGVLLMDRRDFTGGAECLTRLVELDDTHVEGYINLGRCLMELGRPEEAQKYLFRSLQVAPEYGKTNLFLGNLFARYWRLGEAREQFQRVIELQENQTGAYNNLSGIAVLEGNIDEALSLLRTALKFQPDYCVAADNLLLNLNYSDSYTPEQVRDEHYRLAELYNVPVQKHECRQHRRGEKIRVGYVSGDFRSHSVAFFLEPVLRHHNKEDVEIFCYDMVTVPDDTTSRMMGLGWAWRPVYGLSDSETADQIRADGIDILVDLAGHTLGNRLGVFALRPAPVQLTWLGYPNTTGLKQMDFRLTDEWSDPTGMTDHLYSERLVRLPRSFLCYAPPASAPEVAPLSGEPIIFCCFNNYPKVSDTVLTLWARILHAAPGSQLLLKCGSLEDSHVRTLLEGRFAERGIDPSRLILDRFTVHREEHLQRYGDCHIALDTFPYNGTTTTCEALWMGVPVVTLAGATHASRVGVSILNNAGLSELIALSADQYVEIAVGLAKEHLRLYNYRNSLRTQLLSSRLMDAGAFTTDLEEAYKRMLDQPACNF